MKFSLNEKNVGITIVLVGALCLSFSALSQEQDNAMPAAAHCPPEFFALPIFPDAKLCQIFGEELPASMTYHAATDQQTTQSFYTEQLGEADHVTSSKGRIQMEYDNANRIIMISKDGAGTQIDVLVKS